MSLRDRLRDRPRPAATYALRVDDDTEPRRRVEEAQNEYAVAQLRTGDEAAKELRRAQTRLDKAKTALDACFEYVTVRAMPPSDFEALIAEHPPRDSSEQDDAWNTATFPRQCFLACVEGDLSRQEWEQVLDQQCSQGEREGLYYTALAVNVRTPESTVGKDWTQTPV